MTRDEHRDFALWYLGTYVYLKGTVVYIRDIEQVSSISDTEVKLHVGVRVVGRDTKTVIVTNFSDVKPISQHSRIVDSGTRYGQVYVTRSPRRQFRKSLCPQDFIILPRGADVNHRVLAENYVKNSLAVYTPEEAKQRVLSGAALWSAVSDRILVGAVQNNPRFVCAWKGRMVGTFALDKSGEPDVKKLTLSKSNEFLVDSITSSLVGVQCRVGR